MAQNVGICNKCPILEFKTTIFRPVSHIVFRYSTGFPSGNGHFRRVESWIKDKNNTAKSFPSGQSIPHTNISSLININ